MEGNIQFDEGKWGGVLNFVFIKIGESHGKVLHNHGREPHSPGMKQSSFPSETKPGVNLLPVRLTQC